MPYTVGGPLAGSAAASGYRVQGAPDTSSQAIDNQRYNADPESFPDRGPGVNDPQVLYQTNTFRASNPYIDPNAYYFGGSAGGAQSWIDQNNALARGYEARTGPDMGTNTFGQQYMGDRAAQGQALQNYQGVINGTAPSVAQQQLQQGTTANQAAMASQAASARGGGANMAAAQRLAMEQGSQAGAQMNQQAALLRANEVNQAMGGYAQQAQSRAALSGQLAGQQAGFQQNATGQNDAMAQMYANQNYQVANAQLQAQQQRYAQQSQNSLEAQKMNMAANEANAQRGTEATKGLVGGAMSAIGGMAMFSDMRMKENVQPAGRWEHTPQTMTGPAKSYEVEEAPKVGDTLAAMEPYSYTYKDPALGQGQRAGIMAQDMEKTPLGRAAVMNTPQGKAIDMKAATSLALAGATDHEKRLRALEAERATYGETQKAVDDAKRVWTDQKAIGALHGGDPVGAYQAYERALNARQAVDLEMQKTQRALGADEEDRIFGGAKAYDRRGK